jgi:hypothetical protein
MDFRRSEKRCLQSKDIANLLDKCKCENSPLQSLSVDIAALIEFLPETGKIIY